MQRQVEDEHVGLIESFKSLFSQKELLAKVIEFFPYPIQIFSLDGIARMINKATIDMIGIRSTESHIGIYNCFEDPVVQQLGFMDQLKGVLKGKTVYLTDFNAPYQDLIKYFSVADRDIQTISSDITCFPLLNSDGVMEFFAVVFIFKNVYRSKKEIELGRQYLETHWREPFNAEKTAKAALTSKAHFTKLFKKHIGVTPHEYYINLKIGKLKEKLLDVNLSIAQAFEECNLDYNGHSAKLFRERVGATPSEYRRKK